jgi:hypothetical protein
VLRVGFGSGQLGDVDLGVVTGGLALSKVGHDRYLNSCSPTSRGRS